MNIVISCFVVVVTGILFGTASTQAQDAFILQRLPSGFHIELQPQGDHHRIHCRIRVINMSNTTCYAQIETVQLDSREFLHTVAELFRVENTEEVWDIYLRAPRYTAQEVSYKLTFGHYDFRALDTFNATTGFRWDIKRGNGGKAIIESRDAAGADLPLNITVRVAQFINGQIEIFTETVVRAGVSGINFGVRQDQNAVPYASRRRFP